MTDLPFLSGADAYLQWGLHVHFKGFGDIKLDEKGVQVGLLVEWKIPPVQPGELPLKVEIAGFYLSERFATLSVDAEWLLSPNALPFFNKFINRCELASPVAPYAPSSIPINEEFSEGGDREWMPQAEVLLACIDDAFPIASRRFFNAKGGSRVLRIWDQQYGSSSKQTQEWLQLGEKQLGLPNADFGYGGELVNHSGFQLSKSKPGLLSKLSTIFQNAPTIQIQGKTSISNLVELPCSDDANDDKKYYQHAGLTRLRARVTHGAHVLDVMAGPIPVRSRISPSRDLYGGGDGSATAAPGWTPAADVASTADLVLVQLPEYAVNDPSGRWLARNVLDGLHYIIKAAGPSPEAGGKVKKVVVNLSWGPQTGPHDGTSLLEEAIDDLIDKAKIAERELAVVLPAGNSFSSRAHAQFLASEGCKELVWCVPPGSTTPAFLEVWWPAEAKSSITVCAPDGTALTLSDIGIETTPKKEWGITCVHHGNRRMALVTLAPTFKNPSDHLTQETSSAITAPHGKWLITVAADSNATGDIHLFIARADHNMGAKRHSSPSYLLDPVYEAMRRTRTGKFAYDPTNAKVRRDSTLNGLATGQKTYVAGGYRLSDQHTSWYSSSGPSPSRIGPDCIYPCDESIALFGLKAGAVRDGAVVRLTGTSVAAPQLARDIAGLPMGTSLVDPIRHVPPHKRKGLGRR